MPDKKSEKALKTKIKEKGEKKIIKTKNQIDYSTIYEATKTYPAKEALEIIKKISRTKFDATVEVHFHLGINSKKSDQQVRGAVNLPHGTGKTIRIAAFVSPENEAAAKAAGADLVGSEELINEIKKTKKTDFQVAVAEPSLMRNLAVIAKILGTRGLMPSPKNETISPNPAKIIEELKKGKISFKNDDTANIHTIIGKVSFNSQKLLENYETLLATIKKVKPNSAKGIYIKNISFSASMSPGVKVTIN